MLFLRRASAASGGGLSPNTAINGITGTSSPLDGIATANGLTATGATELIVITENGVSEGQLWQLQAVATASNGVTAQRPQDYNAGTNARCWIRILG